MTEMAENGPWKMVHDIFIISQLWLTSHLRSTVVLWSYWTQELLVPVDDEDAEGEMRVQMVYNREAASSSLTIAMVYVIKYTVDIYCFCKN